MIITPQTLGGDRQTVHIHPSSTRHRRSLSAPACVFYNELVVTTKQYMRDVCAIDERWLPEVAPQAYRAAAASASSSALASSSTSASSVSSSLSKSPSSSHAAGKPAAAAAVASPSAARVGNTSVVVAGGAKHQSPHGLQHNLQHGSKHGSAHTHARPPIGAVTTAPRRQ